MQYSTSACRRVAVSGATLCAPLRDGPNFTVRIGRIVHWLNGRSAARLGLVVLVLSTVAAAGWLAEALVEGRSGAALSILTAAVVLLSAFASSIAGFAFSALAGGAFAHLKIDPVHAVQTMVVCSIAIQSYAVWKIRESIRWRALWPMLAAGAATVPSGVWLLLHIDSALYAGGLGVFMTGYAAYLLLRREPRVIRGSVWADAFVGALGGVAGGLAGLPGALVTIWCSMRGWDKVQQRAVYQPFILAMQVVTILCLRWQAAAHIDVAQTLSIVPFALLGAVGGLALFRRISNGQFQLVMSALLAVSGVGLLVGE